ncbi:unnamed protein product [Ceutorhynchus assimilis]|uniref:Uncharacterized protein n=1 Tax=Ceutorhynchus assimilis TaxID=467358 RepID=A0A9N9MUD7_9CUCU|nr:unnamed protein product [Ceutorhynchus assimilis]
MSGDEDELNKYDDPNLKGLKRHFNSTTIRGRANVAIATYASVIVYILYAKFIKGSNKCPECPTIPAEKADK